MKKLLYLISAVYIILYCTSYQFIFSSFLSSIWYQLVPPFADLLGFEGEMILQSTGSGDKYFNYYQLVLFFIVAAVIGVILRFTFFKERRITKFMNIVLVLVRYYLAAQMVNYGLAKLFYLQFSEPSLGRLEQPYGNSSPMGLLWTFMGYSKTYTMFTGLLELIGGLFLLTKRTTTLGALMTFGVMLNVMMLNFCYDVPVKILSSHMVLLSMFLIGMDGNRLLNFFLNREHIAPKVWGEIIPEKYFKTKNVIKWLALILYLIISTNQMYNMSKKYGGLSKNQLLTGEYSVDQFEVLSNEGIKQELPSEEIWDKVYMEKGKANIYSMDGNSILLMNKIDSLKNAFRISSYQDTIGSIYSYEMIGDSLLVLDGNQLDNSIHAELKKKSKYKHLLMNRGFNWIQEHPYNR